MEQKKDKNKIYCKNGMCPCNNTNGDDGTASLEDFYCLSKFCEYPGACMSASSTNESNSK